jgi:AbrB family looped-hinge helix DNA binding protein
MQTKVSTKGQVVLPSPIRRKLCLETGDSLDADVVGGRIVLTPKKRRRRRARIVKDPVTGWPVLTAGPSGPKLTHKQVEEILADSRDVPARCECSRLLGRFRS